MPYVQKRLATITRSKSKSYCCVVKPCPLSSNLCLPSATRRQRNDTAGFRRGHYPGQRANAACVVEHRHPHAGRTCCRRRRCPGSTAAIAVGRGGHVSVDGNDGRWLRRRRRISWGEGRRRHDVEGNSSDAGTYDCTIYRLGEGTGGGRYS